LVDASTAIGVKDGPVPALGYLVEVRGRRIAFAGDQNGDNPAFAAMIKGEMQPVDVSDEELKALVAYIKSLK
jgi:hypothetical protein